MKSRARVRTQRSVPVLVCGLVTQPSLSCRESRSSGSCRAWQGGRSPQPQDSTATLHIYSQIICSQVAQAPSLTPTHQCHPSHPPTEEPRPSHLPSSPTPHTHPRAPSLTATRQCHPSHPPSSATPHTHPALQCRTPVLEYTVEHHTSAVGGVGLVVKEAVHESTGQFPEVTVWNLLTEHLAKRRVILQGGYKHQGYSCYCVCYTARSLSTNHTDPHQLKIPPPHQQRPSPPPPPIKQRPSPPPPHQAKTQSPTVDIHHAALFGHSTYNINSTNVVALR